MATALDIIKIQDEHAALFVQWRFGFTPEAARRFCKRDVRRRPKLSKEVAGRSVEFQWLIIWVLVLQHSDTLNALLEFNKKFPPVAVTGADLSVAGRGQVTGTVKSKPKRMPGLGLGP